MNGTVKLSAVLAAGLVTRSRIRRLPHPTSAPSASASSTPQAKLATASANANPDATAATAVRRSTSAVASLSRLSPSSSVTTRGAMPRRLAMEVATASVGLRIAPNATPSASPMPGMTVEKNRPSPSALSTTSSTDSPAMGAKSRRNSIAGSCTAAE